MQSILPFSKYFAGFSPEMFEVSIVLIVIYIS